MADPDLVALGAHDRGKAESGGTGKCRTGFQQSSPVVADHDGHSSGGSCPTYRCIDSVGLEVDAIVGHVHGDEKRDALVEHAAGVYVGDTVTDIRSALDASAIAVGVTTGPDDARKLVAAVLHETKILRCDVEPCAEKPAHD